MRQLRTTLGRMSIAMAATALVGAGCQRPVNVPEGRLAELPLEMDEAMEIRDWERMSAYYQNPRFIAGPTGFWFETPYEPTQAYYALTETPMFLGQTLFLPVALIVTPPLTPVEYAGQTLEPTYHAMPPLPPSPGDRQPPPSPRQEPEPAPEPGPMIPPPYEDAPGESVVPATQPTRGLYNGMPTTAPATAPATRALPGSPAPATVAPRDGAAPRTRTTPATVAAPRTVVVPATAPATMPTTVPAAGRDLTK